MKQGVGETFVYSPDVGTSTTTWSVIAVDRSGNSSARSNEATVTTVSDPDRC